MKPGENIADGLATDSPEGIHMTGSGAELRWLAVRGGIHDWTIYCHRSEKSLLYIKKCGDKVSVGCTIRKLVPCDDEAFNMYRY